MYNFIKIPSDKFLSLLVALFPLSFILGNLSININILLIIFITLIYHGKKIFKINYFFFDKLFFNFFFLIIFTAVLNDIEFFIDNAYPKGINSTIKSLFFLKYLFLYLSLRYLLENNFLKLKFFFISCSFFSLFVSFDLIFQYFNGQDIFGYKADANAGTYGTGGKLGGPFGDEYIAGGYLQRFSFFTFFLTTLFIKKLDNNYGKVLIIFSAIVFFSAIMLSGNRMPTLLFIMLILLTLVFNKNLRKFILPSIFLFTVIFYTFYKQDLTTRVYFDKFYTQVSNVVDPIIRQDFYNKKNPVYLKEFVSFYDTWLLNKYVGGGIKNFRYYCHKRSNIDTSRPIVCNMHPTIII